VKPGVLAGKVLAAICLAGALPAESAASAGAAAYLTDGAGARWLGMGGAARAAVSGTPGIFWNPAALSRQGPARWQLSSAYGFASFGRSTASLSASRLDDRAGAFGLAWIRHTVSGLEEVDNAGNVTGLSHSAADAFMLSFGRALLYQVRMGITAKYLRQRLFDYSADGSALDVGLLVQPLLAEEFYVGLTLENAASVLAWDTGADDRLARGLGGGVALWTNQEKLLLAADLVHRDTENDPAYHLGLEFWPVPEASGRLGVNDGWLAGGISYLWREFRLDYGFTVNRADLGDVHQFSLTARL